MYSSATMSNSASGLSGAEGTGEGDDLLAGEGEEEEAAGEEEAGGGADDLDFREGDDGGVAEGVGEAFPNGFTGPVGFRTAGGGDFVAGLGEGEGEGAPETLESGRQMASAKMKERSLMKLRWIGRSAGRCPRKRLRRQSLRRGRQGDTARSTAPTLDDALRVAKNFRMSDHRSARNGISHEAPPFNQHLRLPHRLQRSRWGPFLHRARRRGRGRQRLRANRCVCESAPAPPPGLRRRQQDQLSRPDLRGDERDARVPRSPQPVHGAERLQGH